ncbi:YkgJ family cysteine cluster protein [Oryzomonas japonica]|uniref:YkgJ family cysteine cluster protein n=1 Tax=Oryzomonas japonica TaxID=2603858 RepID=A0A7J4ZRF7_9BACT|nr:YkgJ family cysteine cluster protein [Oryzomonas japonica]KAB0665703.1 YkgJ family cysteine cluster protein [Oryzomonas japonica]
MDDLLHNYRQLIARIDALCRGIVDALGEQITCSEGCSDCCTSINLFPVEAASLAAALEALPEEEAEEIRRYVAEHAEDERCPLLRNHRCLLYAARPVVCRTHGLPIIYGTGQERRIDYCPLNLTESESLPGSVIIDLDNLNSLLVAVNALFLSQSDSLDTPERLTIVEALLKRTDPR